MNISFSLSLDRGYGKMEPRIHAAIHLMTADLRRKLQFSEIAHSLNLSESRLRHLFKDETGASPAQYLKAQKLRRAAHLLKTTFLSLKEVMHKTGFADRSHFVRDFKKAYGIPPLKYRNQNLIAKQKKMSQRSGKPITG